MMSTIVCVVALVLGLFIGAFSTYFFIRQIHTQKISNMQSLLDSERSTREKIQNEFRLLASETLQKSQELFFHSAMTSVNSVIKDIRQVTSDADQKMDKQKTEISLTVVDMKKKFDECEGLIRVFEKERTEVYSQLKESITHVLNAENAVRLETSALKKALTSSSGVRGQWGERILTEILEQNNLVRGINFDTQVTLGVATDEQNELRPDFVVYLPGGKKLVIDSKEVASEFLLAQETEDAQIQKTHYEKLVTNIRNNCAKLARKEYQAFLDPDIPFVVMFIPSESAIRAAFSTDPGLFEEATKKKVILASPMTIIPLVYLINHSWNQYKLASNAAELGVVVEDLGNRLFTFVEHLSSVRDGIEKSSVAWNNAVGSWDGRVVPQLQKVESLGGKLKEIERLGPVNAPLRSIANQSKG